MRESHRWICNSWERGTESEANAPEDGRILNRVYENKYFGFSIRLPAGWCITDRASFVALQLRKREQAVRQAKSKEDADAVAQNSETPGALFVVSRHPPDSGKRPNPHLTVMVEKLSAAHLSARAEEWIAAYSEIVKSEGYEPCGKTGRCQVAGRKFQSAVFVVDRELKTFERTTLMASKMRVCNDNHSFPARCR